jgi:cell pole-organizing protein PopZ
MNRADQAPEPSIEELLASIRLIISDADKQGGPLARESRSLSGPAGGYPAPGAHGEVPADEVFDLTDELVFPEEGGRAQPGTPPAAPRAQPGADVYAGQHPHLGPRRGPVPDAAQVLRPEARNGAPGPGAATAPVWSRRELPPGAAQAPSAPRLRQEPPTARPMARNWAGDIQMPVSEHGPVPLFPTPPGNSQSEAPVAAGADGRANAPAEIEVQAAQPEGDGSAAVAVLAQSIARSAIGVLKARELEDATQVDFERLDAGSKADVAERFAAAIESVAQAVHDGQDEAFLTEVIDAQIFEPEPPQPTVRIAGTPAPATEAAGEANAEVPVPMPEAPAEVATWEVKAEAPEPMPEAAARAEAPAPMPEAAARAEAPAQTEAFAEAEVCAGPEIEVQAPTQPAPEPVAAAVAIPETPPASFAPAKPSAAPAPVAMQPLAQAQFMGAAQAPASAQNGGPLEAAVRDMLRPLLVQWLNENMPRILENAIRDEIAVRGLLPKSDS